jgi:hypothetical protein
MSYLVPIVPSNHFRHPELVSGSISQPHMVCVSKTRNRRNAVSATFDATARWTLKQVQGDGVMGSVS